MMLSMTLFLSGASWKHLNPAISGSSSAELGASPHPFCRSCRCQHAELHRPYFVCPRHAKDLISFGFVNTGFLGRIMLTSASMPASSTRAYWILAAQGGLVRNHCFQKGKKLSTSVNVAVKPTSSSHPSSERCRDMEMLFVGLIGDWPKHSLELKPSS